MMFTVLFRLLEQFEAAENGLTLDYDIVSTHSPSPSLSSLPILLPSLPKPLPIVRKTLPLTNTVPLTGILNLTNFVLNFINSNSPLSQMLILP